MGSLILNPGTEPIRGPRRLARVALLRFVRDLGLDGVTSVETPEHDSGGYYASVLSRGKREVCVAVPGLPQRLLRYRGRSRHDPWDFQRLYVDGDSWLWFFAVPAVAENLGAGKRHLAALGDAGWWKE
jgi:hypothetical protein